MDGRKEQSGKFLDSAVSWKEIKPELKQLVRDEVERRQLEKTKSLKKGQEEDKAPWSRECRVARDSLATEEVTYVEKAKTGGAGGGDGNRKVDRDQRGQKEMRRVQREAGNDRACCGQVL